MERARSKHMYDINKIFEVVLAFNGVSDRTMLLNIILTNMMEITSSDAGTLYIIDDNKLHFRIIQNKSLGIFQSSESNDINLPPIILDRNNIQNISAYCAINNEIVIIDDVYEENSRFNFSGPKSYDRMTGYRTRGMLVLPIFTERGVDEEVLGVIQLINPVDPVTGEPTYYGNIYDPPIVPALTKIAANTLSNLTHVNELRMFLKAFATVMTQAIDERSPYNSNHSQNVAIYCERFARHLSSKFPKEHPLHFGKTHIEALTLAALLHDIGKIIIPLSIMDKASRLGDKLDIIRYRFELKKCQMELDMMHKRISLEDYERDIVKVVETQAFVEYVNSLGFLQDEQYQEVLALENLTYINPAGQDVPLLDSDDMEALSIRKGTLTGYERDIMQQHVTITARLLSEIPFWKYYGDVPAWARHHHEFLDGSGYPEGIIGDRIPIEARIIAIMDIFDALIAQDRPYKKGMPIDKSLGILAEMASENKLDKELVDIFIESKLWEGI